MLVPAVLLLALLIPMGAAAQSAAGRYIGRPIEAQAIYIENTLSQDPGLIDLIETQVGQPLDMAAVRESITHLHSLGRFQDVQVDASDGSSGGLRLRYTLIPLHTVERISFTGKADLSETMLRRTITDRFGASPPVGRADDASRLLEQVYEDHGYLWATVRPLVEERHDPDRTLLTFQIEAGPQATIGRITVKGTPHPNQTAFLSRIRAAPGEPYRASQLRSRLNDYVEDLRKRWFYLATASFDPAESLETRTVDLDIAVDRGPAVTVRFEGDPIPQSQLDDLVPVEREGSVEEDLLEDSEARIEEYLRRQGFWKADVSYRREDRDGTLEVVFTVRRGLLYRVDTDVVIRGNSVLDGQELRQLVPFRVGAVYVDAQLTSAASAIRDLYLRRGFAGASVKAGANEADSTRAGEGAIRPEIVIVEGPRTIVGAMDIDGNTAINDAELLGKLGSKPGEPFYAPQTLIDRDVIVREYLNRGYASATVEPLQASSSDSTRMDLVYRVEEGPQTIVDHILVVGNAKTDPRVVLRELQFQPGTPLGLDRLFESQRRLNALGLFRSVRITELAHGPATRRDVVITVQEAPRTTIGYGGGIEGTQRLRATGPGGEAEEKLEFAPRGFFEVGRRNLGGKNRSVNLYARVSLRPRDAPDDPEQDGTGIGLSEYRVTGTYLQPRLLGPNMLSITGAVEQGIRSSFNFTRRGMNADVLRRLTPAIRVSGRYSFNTTRTFDERLSEEDQAAIDRLFPQVRLSGFSGAVARDTRDDLLNPTRGTLISGEAGMAARSLGGQVGYMKTYMQGFWFRQLPGPRAIIFATRAAVGLADGFPREAPPNDVVDPVDGEPATIEDLPASERFFAGGDTTIRGFALDTVGAPDTITPTGFPTGGNAVLIMNGELRVPVWGDFGAAFFVDGGNVFRRVTDFDFGELRGSVGFGVRYRSPIGPVRVDLGFKLDRREIGGRLESRTAIHFSFGQAF